MVKGIGYSLRLRRTVHDPVPTELARPSPVFRADSAVKPGGNVRFRGPSGPGSAGGPAVTTSGARNPPDSCCGYALGVRFRPPLGGRCRPEGRRSYRCRSEEESDSAVPRPSRPAGAGCCSRPDRISCKWEPLLTAMMCRRLGGASRISATADGVPTGRRRIKRPGDDLLSHSASAAVPSALEDFTAVFGMGTGVAPPLGSPGQK